MPTVILNSRYSVAEGRNIVHIVYRSEDGVPTEGDFTKAQPSDAIYLGSSFSVVSDGFFVFVINGATQFSPPAGSFVLNAGDYFYFTGDTTADEDDRFASFSYTSASEDAAAPAPCPPGFALTTAPSATTQEYTGSATSVGTIGVIGTSVGIAAINALVGSLPGYTLLYSTVPSGSVVQSVSISGEGEATWRFPCSFPPATPYIAVPDTQVGAVGGYTLNEAGELVGAELYDTVFAQANGGVLPLLSIASLGGAPTPIFIGSVTAEPEMCPVANPEVVTGLNATFPVTVNDNYVVFVNIKNGDATDHTISAEVVFNAIVAIPGGGVYCAPVDTPPPPDPRNPRTVTMRVQELRFYNSYKRIPPGAATLPPQTGGPVPI